MSVHRGASVRFLINVIHRERLSTGFSRVWLGVQILIVLTEADYDILYVYMLLCKLDYFTVITANSLHCACLLQITATSSKVTTISNWKTAAWRLSSWAKSQKTGSVVEHFQNVSHLAYSCNDIWPHKDIAVVLHTIRGCCSANCFYPGNSARLCGRHVPSSLYNQPPAL